jgi:deoxycytidylate deaminase
MIPKHDFVIDFVVQQAKLSKCKDKGTAAALVSLDMQQIYSLGINGGPAHGRDCLCAEHKDRPKYTCVHAEMNCLVKNRIIDNTPKVMICTKQPCQMCASLIVNANTNIVEVWYIEPYWDNTGLDILREAGIKVKKLFDKEVLRCK